MVIRTMNNRMTPHEGNTKSQYDRPDSGLYSQLSDAFDKCAESQPVCDFCTLAVECQEWWDGAPSESYGRKRLTAQNYKSYLVEIWNRQLRKKDTRKGVSNER